MRLIIKILQGDECVVEVRQCLLSILLLQRSIGKETLLYHCISTLQVEKESTVLEVKKKIHAQCETPVSKQRLLFLGKTLIDEKQLAEYPTIKDDSKIYLVVKTPDSLVVALQKFFKLHFPQSVADKHTTTVHADLLKQIDNMSLDDIERLAKFYIDKDMLENSSN